MSAQNSEGNLSQEELLRLRAEEIRELERKIKEYEIQIADYQSLLTQTDEYKNKVKEQTRYIRRERDQLRRLTDELEQKNKESERKSQELMEILNVVDAYKEKLKDQKKELMRKEKDLKRSNDLLSQMNQELSEKNRELSRMSEELFRMARTDALTGLFNRRTFMEQLDLEFQKSLRYGRSLCCIIYDIDFFKKVNDTFGHLQGDEVLRQIAKVTKDATRNCDFVARYGGEEFVILLPETDLAGGIVLADRLRKAVEKHDFPKLDKPGEYLKITISLGLADSSEKNVQTGEKLLNYADTALYSAKEGGRNQVVVFHEGKMESSKITPLPISEDRRQSS